MGYPSAEKQSVYSTAPADWARNRNGKKNNCMDISSDNLPNLKPEVLDMTKKKKL